MYIILRAAPSVADYRRLREETSLSLKTIEAAERGLLKTLFAVQVHAA